LRILFRFDRWHVSPLRERDYARAIIKYLNGLPAQERKSALEIGCGLGDIIRHIDFRTRTGFDAAEEVLGAARFLSRWGRRGETAFSTFRFPDGTLTGRYDAIIMVNWIHNICPDVLRNSIEGFTQRNLADNGKIVLDTVSDREYKYNHDISALTKNIKCHLHKLGCYQRGREVYVISPLKN